MNEERLVTEVPSSLKQLARLVVRGFYNVEDALIVDILVRNPCMKEDDICDLLKFERKQLRARIAQLKNDKFIQVRLRMETGPDGKAQKVNYYFINYKSFVNVVKYKLDLMRKRMETEERDATSRASFKCPNCLKTFTDLEADQLYDFLTSEFRCTYCREVVEEDQSAMLKKDSRLLLAKFNEQLETLFILLREVEGIKLAPEILEPEPVDLSSIRGLDHKKLGNVPETWSGEASRRGGFAVEETTVDVRIGEEFGGAGALKANHKETPIWLTESTVVDSQIKYGADTNEDSANSRSAENNTSGGLGKTDDIMSVLLAHEKKTSSTVDALNRIRNESESSEEMMEEVEQDEAKLMGEIDDDEEEEDDSNIPNVTVGNKSYSLVDINDEIIAEMTQAEKEIYVQLFQEYYSHIE